MSVSLSIACLSIAGLGIGGSNRQLRGLEEI